MPAFSVAPNLALLPLGLIIPKLWDTFWCLYPNVGTGVQATSAFKAPNGASHSELGWGRSLQEGHAQTPVFPKANALERGWMKAQAVVSALAMGN